jgi:hypothetical protein
VQAISIFSRKKMKATGRTSGASKQAANAWFGAVHGLICYCCTCSANGAVVLKESITRFNVYEKNVLWQNILVHERWPEPSATYNAPNDPERGE